MNFYVWDEVDCGRECADDIDAATAELAALAYAKEDSDGLREGIYDAGHPIVVECANGERLRYTVTTNPAVEYYARLEPVSPPAPIDWSALNHSTRRSREYSAQRGHVEDHYSADALRCPAHPNDPRHQLTRRKSYAANQLETWRCDLCGLTRTAEIVLVDPGIDRHGNPTGPRRYQRLFTTWQRHEKNRTRSQLSRSCGESATKSR